MITPFVRSISLLFILVLTGTKISAQTARVQFVHNCADHLADSLDVYRNGVLWLDNIGFRNASAFVTIPAGNNTSIQIASKESASSDEAFYTFDFSPIATQRYQMIASGLLSETGYQSAEPFALHLLTGAKEAAPDNSGIEVMVYNGCTDLPIFDLAETNLIQINAFDDAAYGQFSAYESIFNANYTFTLQSEDNQYNLGIYNAPLSTLGFGNKATTIIASGFLNPLYNNGGPRLGLFLTQPTGGPLVPLATVTSQIQLFHNSADQALGEVDVYLNGQKFINQFAFRTASAFVEIPAQPNTTIDIAPNESWGVNESVYTISFNAVQGEKYSGIIQGLLSEGIYNPSPPLALSILPGARTAASSEESTDIRIVNGSTDSPPLHITDTGSGQALTSNLTYGNQTEYNTVLSANSMWRINDAITWQYIVPMADSNLIGKVITFFANGFIHPEFNNSGAPFGLWYVSADGGSFVELERIIIPPLHTRAQIIHNSADPLVQTIDVYANGQLVHDNLQFRQATPFLDLEISLGLQIAFAPQNSTSAQEALVVFQPSLLENDRSVLVVNGIASSVGFNPAPQLTLHMFSGAREIAETTGNTDVLICHGGTDTPPIDINEITLPLVGLVDNLNYGGFAGYYNLGTSDNYAISITDASGAITLAQYNLPLSSLGLENKAITLFAGGFLNPVNNSNESPLHVWGATAEGNTFALPVYVGTQELNALSGFSVFPNPTSEKLFIRSEPNRNPLVSYCVMDAQGRNVLSKTSAEIHTGWQEINVSQWPEGMYLLQVNNGQLSETLRFSVIR